MNLSVIVPNYNNSKYIRKCLESIINQTYKFIEIIVVDDCSTDKSVLIVNELKRYHENIKLIQLKSNRGVSYARHIGIQESSGDYITTLDSDDFYYDNHKIENEMNLLYKWKVENKDVITYSRIITVDRMDEILKKDKFNHGNYKSYNGNILFYLLSGMYFRCTPRDYIMKKEIYFEMGGYDFDMSLYEDLDLLLSIASKYEFYSTDRIGTAYRQLGTGLSSVPYNIHQQVLQQLYLKYDKELPFFRRFLVKVIRKILNIKFYLINILSKLYRNLKYLMGEF